MTVVDDKVPHDGGGNQSSKGQDVRQRVNIFVDGLVAPGRRGRQGFAAAAAAAASSHLPPGHARISYRSSRDL